MSEFKTPGVYVEEIPKFPPSVAQVETAVPSFIGYTQQAIQNGESQHLKPVKITSLVEYETYFGKANKESIRLQDTQEKGLTLLKPNVKFLMYYSLQMYFANGGGPCYIVSVGDYTGGVSRNELKQGLDASVLKEESTLVVFPDAISMADETEFYTLYQDAIAQTNTLKNRFVLLDTYLGESSTIKDIDGEPVNAVEYLRAKINPNMHAAAYYPHLKTVLSYAFDEETSIVHKGLQTSENQDPFFDDAFDALTVLKNDAALEFAKGEGASLNVFADIVEQAIAEIEKVNVTADAKINLTEAQSCLAAIKGATVDISDIEPVIAELLSGLATAKDINGDAHGKKLKDLKVSNSALYSQIKKEIESLKVVLPPSSTIAGVYAKVDATKGVWKAPANVGLKYVITTTEKISDSEQAALNEHVDGKSINAIRNFTGKGTMVWGARTFDGNNNEWRYISVRRLFDMVEQSVLNATEKFLFEPNDASTWIRAKAMIENYLNQLWSNGALAGSTPEQAYYVSVGKETTSTQEIAEGRMNILVGLAATRPAEFIVLNFSHKLQS